MVLIEVMEMYFTKTFDANTCFDALAMLFVRPTQHCEIAFFC
jgi:hypothetical protein